MNRWFVAGFLVLLTSVATGGQSLYFHASMVQPGGWTGAASWVLPIGVSVCIEMIGVYLAGMAHAALMDNQSAGMLRAGSYGVGALTGSLNYAHFAHGVPGQPNTSAVTFGFLSASSPWLWAIYSRWLHRVELAALGLVDPRGVKLATSRKLWHPFLSLRVVSWSSWTSVQDPRAAVAGWMAGTRKGRSVARRFGVVPALPGPIPEPVGTWPAPSVAAVELGPELPPALADEVPPAIEQGPEQPGPSAEPVPALAGTTRNNRMTRAERLEQLAALRRNNPGISEAAIAAAMGVSDRYVRKLAV
jgi:hypothetical protein